MIKKTDGAAGSHGWVETGYNLPIEVEYGRSYNF